MNQTSEGDLIYIPSSVRLTRKDATGSTVDYIILSKPYNLLVVGVDERSYEVLYNRKKWLVEKRKTYGVNHD
tara:strand:+ start:1933 stop:2148 length:216 start_codon:yes stop_codon:yes gene_type:complete